MDFLSNLHSIKLDELYTKLCLLKGKLCPKSTKSPQFKETFRLLKT